MRELVVMFESRGRAAWAHTSAILALLANIHRDPKKHGPWGPADFNPYVKEQQKPIPKITDLSILRTVFVENSRGERT